MKKFLYLMIVFFVFGNSSLAVEEDNTFILQSLESKSEENTVLLEAQTSFDVSEYKKISLSEAVDYAIKHNLDIKGNRINTDIAKNNIKSAGRFKNPYAQAFINQGRAGVGNPNSVGLMIPLEVAKRGARKNLAKANLELTKGNVTLAELDLRMDVRVAYVDLAAAKSILKILNKNKKVLQELLDIAQKKYKTGVVSEMDLIQTKIVLNQLLIQINSAALNVHIARYNFNRLLNAKNFDSKEEYLPEDNDFMALLTPKPTDVIADVNVLSEFALKKRQDLKNAKQEIDIAQKNVVLTVRQRIPNIEMGAGYLFLSSGVNPDGRFAQGTYFGANVVDIPLFYQYSPEIRNAKLKLEQKQIAYESLKSKVMINLHSAYDEFTTAQKSLNYYNNILLTESEQFLKKAKNNYKKGDSAITDFIAVQKAYQSILMEYTFALVNYYDSWINILREIKGESL